MTAPAPAAAPDRTAPTLPARLLGAAGELLITLGVLLGLFVVWQLWWTDVVAGRHQQEVLQTLDWAYQDDLRPAGDDEPAPAPAPVEEPVGPPPVLEEPTEEGATFATLRVPRWGSDYVRTISHGTSRPVVLDVLGIGHYEGTAMPGKVGNFAVAGHRTTYNKPFNRVEELEVGDPLVVQTPDTWYVYRVTSTQIVLPRQVEVIAPVPDQPGATPTTAMMTLTTCHPMFSAQERFIVHAELDHWLPVQDGTPAEITGGA